MLAKGALIRFLDDCRQRRLSPNTVDHRRRILGAFEREYGAPLLEAGMTDIDKWLQARHLAESSLNAYISAFARFYEWAGRVELRFDDPTMAIHRPRIPRRVPRPVADDDLAYALSVATQPMRAWLTLAGFEGMRAMEIAALRREHLLDNREPPLVLIDQGKGRKDRLVPLHPRALVELRSAGLPSRGLIFRRDDGRSWPPGMVSRHVSRFLDGIGVEATAHNFRHWFGTGVYQESKDLRLTQELMGHGDPRTTALYTAWACEEAAEVVCRLAPRNGNGNGNGNGRWHG